MIVLVTIHATTVRQGIREFPLVAVLAVHPLVLPFQGEIRFAMIEIIQALDTVEGFLTMTLLAILTETVFMRVFVAIIAVVVCHPGKFCEFCPVPHGLFMALGAVHFFMLALQGKRCFPVVEAWCRAELLKTMAITAIPVYGSLVVVGVAVGTFGCKAKES